MTLAIAPSANLTVLAGADDPDLVIFAVAGTDGVPMPAIPEMGSVWKFWTNAITLTITQQQQADEAFATAAESGAYPHQPIVFKKESRILF